MALTEALRQSWPAFVLVGGLLLVGLVAHADGIFLYAGRMLERLPGPPVALLILAMALVTVVTALLNLDTSVVFLTPVLVYAARRRGVEEEPFLFAAIFMSNASSLYLPGSNLTNVLVFAREPLAGGAFASRMLPAALSATLVTALGILFLFRRSLNARAERERDRPPALPDGGLGALAILAAAILTVTLRNPAPEVLGVGLLAVGLQLARGRLELRELRHALGPLVLGGLFALSVALGVLAREWDGPTRVLGHAGLWGTAAVGGVAAMMINNLPAAVLLSARPPAHPDALLLGLNLAPNLAVSGSLSAYLWLKAAGQLELRPSILAFSRRGLLLAPSALLAAGLVLGALKP